MKQHWRTPPRRSAASIQPLTPHRSRRRIMVDRVAVGTILGVWVGLILAIASCVSAT